jgi:hypothetical protein
MMNSQVYARCSSFEYQRLAIFFFRIVIDPDFFSFLFKLYEVTHRVRLSNIPRSPYQKFIQAEIASQSHLNCIE